MTLKKFFIFSLLLLAQNGKAFPGSQAESENESLSSSHKKKIVYQIESSESENASPSRNSVKQDAYTTPLKNSSDKKNDEAQEYKTVITIQSVVKKSESKKDFEKTCAPAKDLQSSEKKEEQNLKSSQKKDESEDFILRVIEKEKIIEIQTSAGKNIQKIAESFEKIIKTPEVKNIIDHLELDPATQVLKKHLFESAEKQAQKQTEPSPEKSEIISEFKAEEKERKKLAVDANARSDSEEKEIL